MKIVLLGVAAIVAAAAYSDPELTRKEFAQLVGEWKVIRMEREGRVLGENEYSLRSMVFRAEDLNKRVRIDPTKSPKWIDEISPQPQQLGPDVPGLYKIEGDRLYYITTFAFKHGDPVRPTDFTTQPGDHRTLVVLERVKK